jgi:hypothetical protein
MLLLHANHEELQAMLKIDFIVAAKINQLPVELKKRRMP